MPGGASALCCRRVLERTLFFLEVVHCGQLHVPQSLLLGVRLELPCDMFHSKPRLCSLLYQDVNP